jgi:hypothetical protein
MSLKSVYFEGVSGFLEKMNDAFQAGINWVGSATAESTVVDLGDRNGAAFQTGATGLYFDISSISVNYRVWFNAGTETAPPAAGRTLVQVTVLPADNSEQCANKLKTAINQLSGTPFTATKMYNAVRLTTSSPGPALVAPSVGTLGGTAVVQVETAGQAPSGNYTAIADGLLDAAKRGLTKFTITIETNYNPSYLRGNNGQNVLVKAYLAGISQGLGNQQLYSYEVTPKLNISDTVTTRIDLNFNFAGSY